MSRSARIFLASLILFGAAMLFSAMAVPPLASSNQTYQVTGVIREINPDFQSVVISHETVTNYMPAMTMPFIVKNTNELRGLQPGATVTFQMVIAGDNSWIEQLRPATKANPLNASSVPGLRVVRDVDPLAVGDRLPEYHFTNELGHAIRTGEFLGQPFAFTFFFTRCPYPVFCPLMSANFQSAENILLKNKNAPPQWHLFSISFDPAHDSPAVLKNYAERYDYHPAHWSFVTGDLVELTALGDQVGEYFGTDESGGINHNLRTVVVNAQGRIQKIFTDNKWTASDLAAEIIKAAAH